MTMIRTPKINAFLREACRQGLDTKGVLQSYGLSMANFRGARRAETDFENVRIALTALADITSPDFAVRFGSRWSFMNFGIVGYGLLTYKSFGPFVDRWIRCIEFIGLPLLFRSVLVDEDWQLVMTPREPLPDAALRLCVIEACAQVFPVFRELTGLRLRPIRLDIAASDFGRDQRSDALFDHLPVRTGAAQNSLVMRRGDREVPIDVPDDYLLAFCEKYCRRILPGIANGEFPLRQIREKLLLSRGRPDSVADVAAQLGMSKRSLNRHLAQHGCTYAGLVNEYRRDYAFELLRTNQLCIKEVAFIVGFDSAGSLQRAFRGWTGQSVGKWMQQTLGARPLRH